MKIKIKQKTCNVVHWLQESQLAILRSSKVDFKTRGITRGKKMDISQWFEGTFYRNTQKSDVIKPSNIASKHIKQKLI